MSKKFKFVLFLFCISLFVVSCSNGSKSDSDNDATTVEVSEGSPVTCLWSSVAVKASPEQNGKYVTAIYLGESATFLGETTIDSTVKNKPKEFVKIKLKDGTKGWVQSSFVGINTKPSAIKNTTKLYNRPDILSAGKNELERLQFVVVLEQQDGWAKIKGKKRTDSWFKDGWVKLENLTSSEADITVAILAERALSKETPEKQKEALNEIIGNSDLSSSIFISNVSTLIESLSEDASISNPIDANESEGD